MCEMFNQIELGAVAEIVASSWFLQNSVFSTLIFRPQDSTSLLRASRSHRMSRMLSSTNAISSA